MIFQGGLAYGNQLATAKRTKFNKMSLQLTHFKKDYSTNLILHTCNSIWLQMDGLKNV